MELVPAINVLNRLLPEVFPRYSAQRLQDTIESLKLSDIRVEETGLAVDVRFDVEELPQQIQPEALLNEQEMQQWETNWQMMDALITFTVKHYATTTKLEDLRATLLKILLDARYQLQEALTIPVAGVMIQFAIGARLANKYRRDDGW